VVPGGGFRGSFRRGAGVVGVGFLIRAMKKIPEKYLENNFRNFFEIFPGNFQCEKFLKKFCGEA
jgi:hypothetical protein